jgi:hypothetical protein
MIPLVAILAWLPMPLDPITSPYDAYWYTPIEFEDVLDKSIEEIERDLKRKGIRLLELGPGCNQ